MSTRHYAMTQDRKTGNGGYKISRKQSLALRSSVLKANIFEKVIILSMEESFTQHPHLHYHWVRCSFIECRCFRSQVLKLEVHEPGSWDSLATWHRFTLLAWGKRRHWAASEDDHGSDFYQESNESSQEHYNLWSTFPFPFGKRKSCETMRAPHLSLPHYFLLKYLPVILWQSVVVPDNSQAPESYVKWWHLPSIAS